MGSETRRRRRPLQCRARWVVAAVLFSACSSDPVEVYLTTGDRARLLERQADVRLRRGGDDGFPTIEIRDDTAYQEIIGFGAALTDASAWLLNHRLGAGERDALLQELFGRDPGIGFSFIRVDMGASDFALRHYTYDDLPRGRRDPTLGRFSIAPDTAATIPILQRALAINRDLAIMATPWSAPAWMKTPESLLKGTLREDAYDAYAGYFLKFVTAYAERGVPVYAISVANEPHHEPDDYPGMRLDPPQRAQLVGRHLGPLFARSGVATRILEWDHNWDQPESPLAVLADSGARDHIAGVAWHCYGGEVSAQSVVRDAYPDKDVFFTECSGGAWARDFGDNLVWTVRNLVIGATRHWARGVLMWNLALDENHGPHTGGCGNCRGVITIDSRDGSVTRNEEYYAFAHASRFVRRGARRIASTSGMEGLESVAFRNPNDSSIVALILNTNAAERRVAVRHGERAFHYDLPARSLATFVWR